MISKDISHGEKDRAGSAEQNLETTEIPDELQFESNEESFTVASLVISHGTAEETGKLYLILIITNTILFLFQLQRTISRDLQKNGKLTKKR